MSKKRPPPSSSFDWGRLAYRIQVLFALIVPFVFIEALFNYIELPRGALIQLGALLILLVWLMGAISKGELKIIRTPFDLPLLGFVLWAGLSLLWATNFYEGFEKWIQWGACVLFFFLTVNLIQSKRNIQQLLGAFLLAGTLAAVLGICQYLFEVTWVPQIVPPAATFANRNMAAPFMVMTIPLAAAFFLLSRKRIHVLLTVIALGALSLFLFYGGTRSAWLAVALESLFLTMLLARDYFRWKRTPPIWAKKKALVVCAVVCAVGVFILLNLTPSGFEWRVGAAYDRIVTNFSLEATSRGWNSLGVRFRLWENTLRMGEEHFIKGVGVGNFRVFYPKGRNS